MSKILETIKPIVEKPEKEKAPEVNFYFSAHTSVEDFKKMQEEFKKADIYISEQHGWTQKDLRDIRDISSGREKPLHIKEGLFAETAGDIEDELLYNSHKPVYFVDIPSEHELADADYGQQDLQEAMIAFTYNDFENAEQLMLSAAKRNGNYLDKKDRWIAARIKEQIPEMIREHPELKSKDQVKILVQMGASHYPIRRYVAESLKTKQVGERTIVFGFHDELLRCIRFDKPVPEGLLSKAMLEVYIKKLFVKELGQVSNQLFIRELRKRLKDVSRDQINQISVAVGNEMLFKRDDFDEKAFLKKALMNILNIDIEELFNKS